MKGFTLVELLVSVAIMGILASMSVSSFDAYKRRANDTVAISQARDIIMALETYRIDSGSNPASQAIVFQVDGTVGGTTDIAPGFSHNEGVYVSAYIASNDGPAISQATHCLGTNSSFTGYEDHTSLYGVGNLASGQGGGAGVSNASPYLLADGSDCP